MAGFNTGEKSVHIVFHIHVAWLCCRKWAQPFWACAYVAVCFFSVYIWMHALPVFIRKCFLCHFNQQWAKSTEQLHWHLRLFTRVYCSVLEWKQLVIIKSCVWGWDGESELPQGNRIRLRTCLLIPSQPGRSTVLLSDIYLWVWRSSA